MPAVQTNYPGSHAPAYAGMIANQERHNLISRIVLSPTLQFGQPVFQGAADDQVQAFVAGAAFRGVAVVSDTVPPLFADQYIQGSTAAVMTTGVCWVVASVAVKAGEAAFVDANGNLTDVANGDTAIPAIFDSSAAAGALVKLRLA